MNQLIQKWREFEKYWYERKDGDTLTDIETGKKLKCRPFLDDFMDWLAEQELLDKK